MKGPQVEAKLVEYASEVLGASLPEYLRRAKRSLLGLEADRSKRLYRALFGNPPSAFVAAASERFVDAHAGYRGDAGRVFILVPPVHADIFLISSELLAGPDADVDTIILHELCHWAIDGRPLPQIGLKPDSTDAYHGRKLFRRTDTKNQRTTRHTEEFCILLSCAARTFAERYSSFPDRWSVLGSAMRFDVRN